MAQKADERSGVIRYLLGYHIQLLWNHRSAFVPMQCSLKGYYRRVTLNAIQSFYVISELEARISMACAKTEYPGRLLFRMQSNGGFR